jgi:hypothetical protein
MAKTQPNDPKDTRNPNVGTNLGTHATGDAQGHPAPGTPGAESHQPAPVQGPRSANDPDAPRPPSPPAMGAPGGAGTAQPGEVVSPSPAVHDPDTSFHDRAREQQDENARRQREAVVRGLAPVAVLAPGAAHTFGAVVGGEERAAPVGEPEIVPEASGRTDLPPSALNLLYSVCERFGVNPTWDADPRELADWRWNPANRRAGKKESVTIVTAGGMKITEFEDGTHDEETQERLRHIFQSYTFNAVKERVQLPLPDSLVLPVSNVDGQVRTAAHVVRASWRRSAAAGVNPQDAAKDEANRKAAALRGDRSARV